MRQLDDILSAVSDASTAVDSIASAGESDITVREHCVKLREVLKLIADYARERKADDGSHMTFAK
jgi:hypothetical protein